MNLSNKIRLNLNNKVSSKVNNNIKARLNQKVRLKSNNKAIKIIKNWKIAGNINMTEIKCLNLMDVLANILKILLSY